jgi:hypothetical protein
MADWKTAQSLVARKLAVQISAAIAESGKRIILVPSPSQGEGKTHLVGLIAPELERIAPYRFLVTSAAELSGLNPWHVPEDRVVLVDGPAMLEGEGFLKLRKGWMSAFEGSLIVVMGRKTTVEGLEETVNWLNASKIPPIGVVWNEYFCPPLGDRFRAWLRWWRRPALARGLRRLLFGGRSTRETP